MLKKKISSRKPDKIEKIRRFFVILFVYIEDFQYLRTSALGRCFQWLRAVVSTLYDTTLKPYGCVTSRSTTRSHWLLTASTLGRLVSPLSPLTHEVRVDPIKYCAILCIALYPRTGESSGAILGVRSVALLHARCSTYSSTLALFLKNTASPSESVYYIPLTYASIWRASNKLIQ